MRLSDSNKSKEAERTGVMFLMNDRFTLVVSPPTGNSITTPMLLSRVSHSVVPGQWTTTFEGSARWAAVFILNQSRLNGTDLLG